MALDPKNLKRCLLFSPIRLALGVLTDSVKGIGHMLAKILGSWVPRGWFLGFRVPQGPWISGSSALFCSVSFCFALICFACALFRFVLLCFALLS